MKHEGLLIIDMLNDFVQEGAPLEVPDARKILPNIQRRLKNARDIGTSVFFICDSHEKNDREFSRMSWPAHAIKGTKGAEVVEELKPLRGEKIIEKTSYSAFYNTGLEQTLRSLNIEALIITGCVTNICILYTAADAVMRGFYVTVPEDSVAGLSAEEHHFALKQMKSVLGIAVI